MSPKKKNAASGVITFHTPLPVCLLRSEEHTADMKDPTGCGKIPSQPVARMWSTSKCVGAGKREDDSPSGPQPVARQDWLSHTSLRRLQEKMEAENQLIQPPLDTENGFMKELERFLKQRDVTELRRRELQHKRWTERVWFPLQRRVEEHVSRCGPAEAKRRLTLYSQYLNHCNTKGFVFLDTYNLREYDPFLLHIKKPRHYKFSTADFKDLLYLQLNKRLQEERTARSCEAVSKFTRRRAEKLPLSDRPFSESVTSQAAKILQASTNHPVSASRKTVEDETEGRRFSRLDNIPYHISATATPDGRCHQTGCSFSRCGGRQHPGSLHQSFSTSK